MRISLGRCFEGDLDVVGAEDVQEGIIAVGTVVVEGFVEDVPSVALPFPVLGFLGYVIDESLGEGFFGPGGGVHWHLLVWYTKVGGSVYPMEQAVSARLECGSATSAYSFLRGLLPRIPLRS